MADNHTPIVKILLDLGVPLGDISTDKDYLKALIRATNQLDAKDGRYPILQKEIQKLRAISFARGGSPRGGGAQVSRVQPSAGLSPSKLQGTGGQDSKISSSLSIIEGNLRSILDVFRSQLKLDQDQARAARKAQQDDLKKGREEKLESPKSFGSKSKILQKATKPVQGCLGKLLNFFKNILLGGAILGLMKVIENPDLILQPIKDFIDGIIGFFNKILKAVFGTIFAPINFLIGGINGGLKLAMGAIDNVIRMIPGMQKHENTEVPQIPLLKPPQIPTFSKKEDDTSPQEKVTPTDSNIGNQAPTSTLGKDLMNVGDNKSTFVTGSGGFRAFKNGGLIKGPSHQQGGVPIEAEGGEMMFSRKSVDYWGADNLLAMNKEGGGTNKGSITGRFEGGGKVGNVKLNQAKISTANSSQVNVPSPPHSHQMKVKLVPLLGQNKKGEPASASSADQKSVSSFNSQDVNNAETMGIMATYQLIG